MSRPLGQLGMYLEMAERDPTIRQARDPRSGKFFRDRQDINALEVISGMFRSDIDALMQYALRGWILISRCPNELAYAYAGAVQSRHAAPKPAGVYTKTNDYGLLGRYVSDYDFMSAWRIDGGGWLETCSNWNGKDPLDRDQPGDALIADLNDRLVYKLQHGFNDCWLDMSGRPKNRAIGDDFVAFTPSHAQYFWSQGELRSFYRRHGMRWRYG